MNARTILRTSPIALLILVAVLAAVWAVNRPAQAQTTPPEVVGVENFGVDPDAGGYVVLDFRDPSVTEVWATCGGAYPQSGTSQIPSQVMTRKIDPRILKLRVFNNVGRVVTAPVRINCTFDIVGPVAVTPTSLHQQLAKVMRQAG